MKKETKKRDIGKCWYPDVELLYPAAGASPP